MTIFPFSISMVMDSVITRLSEVIIGLVRTVTNSINRFILVEKFGMVKRELITIAMVSMVLMITGLENKEVLCDGTNQMGIILFGDSAGAHFSIPERYVNVSMWQYDTFDDLWWVLSDEMDWPHRSGATGYIQKRKVDVRSFYK
jgi:hypothetical protein